MLELPSEWRNATLGWITREIFRGPRRSSGKTLAWTLLIASLELWEESKARRPNTIQVNATRRMARIGDMEFQLVWPLNDRLFDLIKAAKRNSCSTFFICPPNTGSLLSYLGRTPPTVYLRSLDEYLDWRTIWAACDLHQNHEQVLQRFFELHNARARPEHRVAFPPNQP